MRTLILILFFAVNLTAQTDSTNYHFPSRINCTVVQFYNQSGLVATQSLVPNVTLIDYTGNYGLSFTASDTWPGYQMIIRDANTMLVTPNERFYILGVGCLSPFQTYRYIHQGKLSN